VAKPVDIDRLAHAVQKLAHRSAWERQRVERRRRQLRAL